MFWVVLASFKIVFFEEGQYIEAIVENGHWLKPQGFLLGLGFRNKLCHLMMPIYFEINLN